MSKLVNSELIVRADSNLEKSVAAELQPEVEQDKEPSPEELQKIIDKYHKSSRKVD
jgi:hypothetical protein